MIRTGISPHTQSTSAQGDRIGITFTLSNPSLTQNPGHSLWLKLLWQHLTGKSFPGHLIKSHLTLLPRHPWTWRSSTGDIADSYFDSQHLIGHRPHPQQGFAAPGQFFTQYLILHQQWDHLGIYDSKNQLWTTQCPLWSNYIWATPIPFGRTPKLTFGSKHGVQDAWAGRGVGGGYH